MTNKKNSNHVDIPSVMLSSDDLKSHAPRASQASQVRPGPTQETLRPAATSPVLIVILLCLVGAVAFLYYQLYMQQQAFRETEANLEHSLSQVSKLENQDQSLIETGGNISKQLAVYDTEIRKLWDVSNQLRKNDLPAQNKALDAQQKRLETALTQLEKAKSDLAVYQKSIDQLEKQTATLADAIKTVDALEKKTAQLDKSLSVLAAKDATKEISSLKRRVEETELSIAAIDAHRSQVNRNLDKLTQEVKRLGAGGEPSL